MIPISKVPNEKMIRENINGYKPEEISPKVRCLWTLTTITTELNFQAAEQKKTILFGGSGFFGPIILEKYPEIISVGRTRPPKNLKNKHINIKNLNNLNKLNKLNFDKVIFLIGSSNHHIINKDIDIGIKYNFEPTIPPKAA